MSVRAARAGTAERQQPRAGDAAVGADGCAYRGGESRDWLKTKCRDTGSFVITGFRGEGRLENKLDRQAAQPRPAEAVPVHPNIRGSRYYP